MKAFLENLTALFLALAFGTALLGILARLVGARRTWPFFVLALFLLLLALLSRVE